MADDLVYATAAEVAGAIRTGRVSAAEVIDAQLGRIARHNPALNAIVTLDEAGARRRAQEADEALRRGDIWGPLHGLPVTVKDVFEVAGLRSTCSHRPLAGHVSGEDATAVARLRAAGAIILGKTNMPELAADWQTVSPLFGRANNPWDLTRTPGGSTGGGAAAMAAGLSYLELGSDLAGSLRLPAHFCGVYALIPTDGLVPKSGHLPKRSPGPAIDHLLRVGTLARSVADLQLALSVLAGPDGGEPDLPPVPLGEPAPRRLQDLRIAWSDDVAGAPLSADTRAAMQAFAARLVESGCHVERLAPDVDFARARSIHSLVFFTMIGLTVSPAARFIGQHLGGIKAFYLDLRRYLQAESERCALITALERFLGGWDAWICPVSATPAFKHHEPSGHMGPTPVYRRPIVLDEGTVDYYVANTSFTLPFNVTGNPVVAMPIGHSREGLPIGVQVVGGRWRDMELLATAALLAGVAPPAHPPGYASS